MSLKDASEMPRGIWIITKRELRSHVRSVRMIILLVLFVLAVIGGSYGMSALSISSDVIQTPEVVGWVFKVPADNDTMRNDLMIYFTDIEGKPVDGVDYNITFETKSKIVSIGHMENAPSRSFIHNVNESSAYTAYELQSAFMEYSTGDYSALRMLYDASLLLQEMQPTRMYLSAQVLDLDGENALDDALIMVLDTKDLNPEVDQPVKMFTEDDLYDPIGVLKTNEYGVCKFSDLEGGNLDMTSFRTAGKSYLFSTNFDGESAQTAVSVIFNINLTSLFETDDPNQVLAFVALMFIVVIGPVIGIALSFDTISKERLQNSLDFLLARPVSRRAIAAGKFFGTFLAIAIPATIINICAIFIIWAKTGNRPDLYFSMAFLVFSLGFITIYILIQQIFSTLVKSTATAILSGISLWVFFNLFWSLISLGINALLGNKLGSDENLIFSNRFSLLSPNGVYQMTIMASLPGSTASDYIGVYDWVSYLVMGIWIVGCFIIAVELFEKRMRG